MSSITEEEKTNFARGVDRYIIDQLVLEIKSLTMPKCGTEKGVKLTTNVNGLLAKVIDYIEMNKGNL
jgi:hypothetical protein